MIKASTQNLRTQLENDLVNDFESNIINRYADYADYDAIRKPSQKEIFDDFNSIREEYLEALEQLIRYVDVDEFI